MLPQFLAPTLTELNAQPVDGGGNWGKPTTTPGATSSPPASATSNTVSASANTGGGSSQSSNGGGSPQSSSASSGATGSSSTSSSAPASGTCIAGGSPGGNNINFVSLSSQTYYIVWDPSSAPSWAQNPAVPCKLGPGESWRTPDIPAGTNPNIRAYTESEYNSADPWATDVLAVWAEVDYSGSDNWFDVSSNACPDLNCQTGVHFMVPEDDSSGGEDNWSGCQVFSASCTTAYTPYTGLAGTKKPITGSIKTIICDGGNCPSEDTTASKLLA